MRRVIWSARARAALIDIRAYIAPVDPAAAARLANRLAMLADSLGEFADRGSPVGGGVRQLSVVHPYAMRYRVLRDEVVILRIRHGARRPLGRKA